MKKLIMSHRLLFGMFLAGGLLVLGGFWWAYAVLSPITQPLILHFNDHVGISQIGGMGDLLRVGIFGFLIVVVNFSLAFSVLRHDHVFGYAIGVATLFLTLLLFAGFAAIISVN